MDYNAYSAQQLHRQRAAELARVTELRRRSAERASMTDEAVEAEAPATTGRWHRILVRRHHAPKLAH